MSSYEPPEDEETGSSHDPGVKEKEVTDSREFTEAIHDFDRSDYVLLGMVSSFFSSVLTMFLVWIFVPEYIETAERIVEWVLGLLL